MDNRKLPVRKKIRLENYDYSRNGAYFITICTKNKIKFLSEIGQLPENPVGAGIARPLLKLTQYGKIVEECINNIHLHYANVWVDKFLIMPNHIHLIIVINNTSGRAMPAPTVSAIINQMKGYATKKIGFSIWQKSFYDRIIRNEKEYIEICKYIEYNPIKWLLECQKTN